MDESELVSVVARRLQGREVGIVQRGPRVFVDVRGPLTAGDARRLAEVAVAAALAAQGDYGTDGS